MSYRKGNTVKRYHTINVIVEETVGHHSANVALLCWELSEGEPSSNLLLAALTHDVSEQHTGDIPAPFKWKHPSLARELATAEASYEAPQFELTDKESSILKQADMLDLCYKCLEELRMGNSTVEPLLENGLNYLTERYGKCLLLNDVKSKYYELVRRST